MEKALRRLTAAEYETFSSTAVAGYAAEIAASGALPPMQPMQPS